MKKLLMFILMFIFIQCIPKNLCNTPTNYNDFVSEEVREILIAGKYDKFVEYNIGSLRLSSHPCGRKDNVIACAMVGICTTEVFPNLTLKYYDYAVTLVHESSHHFYCNDDFCNSSIQKEKCANWYEQDFINNLNMFKEELSKIDDFNLPFPVVSCNSL